MRSQHIITYILCLLSFSSVGQEGQFSQYFASATLTNPAFIGVQPTLSFNSNYKRSGSDSQQTFFELMQATLSVPFRKQNSRAYQIGGAGVTFFSEKRGLGGSYQAQKVLLASAYRLKLSKLSNQFLIFGLQGGVALNRISGDGLQWGSQYNRYIGFDNTLPNEVITSEPIFYPVVNFGVIYTFFDNEDYYVRDHSFQIGIAVDNLNEPKISSETLGDANKTMLYKIFGSAQIEMTPRTDLHPSLYALYSQGSYQMNAGMYISNFISSARSKTAIVLQAGAWYRLNDSVILLAGFEVQNFRIGASYDLNTTSSLDINDALIAQNPSYEVSITYNLNFSSDYLRGVSSPIF